MDYAILVSSSILVRGVSMVDLEKQIQELKAQIAVKDQVIDSLKKENFRLKEDNMLLVEKIENIQRNTQRCI